MTHVWPFELWPEYFQDNSDSAVHDSEAREELFAETKEIADKTGFPYHFTISNERLYINELITRMPPEVTGRWTAVFTGTDILILFENEHDAIMARLLIDDQ